MIVGAVFLAEVRAVSRSPIDWSWFRRPFHSDCNYGEGVNHIGVKMGAESDVAFCSLRTHVTIKPKIIDFCGQPRSIWKI
jgi:hypothetical protein